MWNVFTVCFSMYISNIFLLLLGSCKGVWIGFSIIVELIIIEAKLNIAVSLDKCMLINLGVYFLNGALPINMEYGWWSENCLIGIPAVHVSINLLILQNNQSTI